MTTIEMTKSKENLLKEIVDFYLKSHDFNGYPVTSLELNDDTVQTIIDLIEEEKLELHRGDRHANPHIKAFPAEDKAEQIKKIKEKGVAGCLYPTVECLKHIVNQDNGIPFTSMLGRGEPQLSFKAFDLSILEIYRNDPKYTYETDDIHGSISISNEYYDSTEMKDGDKVFIQTFGYCYDSNMTRAVGVFLRYLSDLSPEHQRVWQTKLLDGDFELHPDYYRASILGDFPERVSIFDAFLEEQNQINEMTKKMGKPVLFINKHKAYDRPRHFGFLIRPTQKEYNDFIHLLDKLISDNINRDFFKNDIELNEKAIKENGEKIILPKPTIGLLQEWLQRITFRDPKPKDEMLATFRKVRGLRSPITHKLDDDRFDQKFFRDQRELIIEAYKAIRTLRLILTNHPSLEKFEAPDWLYKGDIWTY